MNRSYPHQDFTDGMYMYNGRESATKFERGSWPVWDEKYVAVRYVDDIHPGDVYLVLGMGFKPYYRLVLTCRGVRGIVTDTLLVHSTRVEL